VERPVATGDFAQLSPESDRPDPVESAEPSAPGQPLDPADRPVIVEVLGSHGQIRARTRLTTLPATLGRGYDADVHIDDPHVCARHAELSRDENGGLVLRDLESVNGIGRARLERAASVQLASGDRVRIGPVEIRVVDAAHPVAASVPLAETRGLTTGIAKPGRALAVVGGAAAAFALLNYQSSAITDGGVTAFQEAVYIIAAVAVWASAWALATRIVSRGFRFLSHWAWALGLAVIALIVTAIGEWVDFIGPSVEAGSWLTAAFGFVLLPVLIAGHLEIASSMSRRSRWRAALSVGAIVVALTLIASLGEDGSDNTWSLDYAGTLKPLPARLIPAVSLDGFMQATEGLQAEVDALAEEPAPDDAQSEESPLPAESPAPDSAAALR
jgi:pSer/pThr/pTyr-binding forkhead associated (FHA) protein